jgi:hypothetical protein
VASVRSKRLTLRDRDLRQAEMAVRSPTKRKPQLNMPANAASAAPPATHQRAGRTALMATRMVTARITTVHVIAECPGSVWAV